MPAKISTKKQIKKSLVKGRNYLRRNLSKKTIKTIDKILKDFSKGKDTKAQYSKRNKYTPSRIRIHNKIIRFFLNMDSTTRKPDLYIFGGVAASGKTSALKRRVKEKAVIINNDDIKRMLAKYSPSPIKKYLLLHAALLHRESGDIETKLVTKAMQQKKDVVLDRTLANFNKSLKIAKRFKNKGYEITTLGTNLFPHIAILRASKRFVKKGRFVPLNIIAKKGNTTNRNVLKMARKRFNKRAVVVDTQRRQGKIIYQKK